jgi:WD40 repeat protein
MSPGAGNATALAVAPKGDLVAAAWANGDLTLWRVAPDRRCHFASTLPDTDTVQTGALAFGHDGAVLFGAGSDGTARAWHVTDPQFPARIGAPAPIPADVHSISVGSGTRQLITVPGEPDGRQRLDLSLIDAIRRDSVSLACSMAGGGLDRSQWAGFLPGTEYGNTCRR